MCKPDAEFRHGLARGCEALKAICRDGESGLAIIRESMQRGLGLRESGAPPQNKERVPVSEVKWYKRIPNSYVIIFFILVLMCVLTYIVPSGEYQRQMMENGRMGVVPGSYHAIDKTPDMTVGLWGLFKAIPKGMVEAASIMILVFFSGGMFELLEKTYVIRNTIGMIVRKVEKNNVSKGLTITILTIIFGILGASIGFENQIPFVPLGVMIALGLGFDIMVGAAIVIGGVAVGFATSPINPYTVGVSHAIAGLPIFSGMGLRAAFCITALLILSFHTIRYAKKIVKDPSRSLVKGISTEGFEIDKEEIDSYRLDGKGKAIAALFASLIFVIVFGVIRYKWYLTEISALFAVYTVIIGLVARMSADEIVNTFMRGAGKNCRRCLDYRFCKSHFGDHGPGAYRRHDYQRLLPRPFRVSARTCRHA